MKKSLLALAFSAALCASASAASMTASAGFGSSNVGITANGGTVGKNTINSAGIGGNAVASMPAKSFTGNVKMNAFGGGGISGVTAKTKGKGSIDNSTITSIGQGGTGTGFLF